MVHSMLRTSALFVLVSTSAAFPNERAETIAKCVSAFATGDQSGFAATASEVRSWGNLEDDALQKAATACLALAPTETAKDEETVAVPVIANTAEEFLARLDADPNSVEQIVMEIAELSTLSMPLDDRAKRLEAAILAYARPLPAAKANENRLAYLALTKINPDDVSYASKVEQYQAALEAQAREDERRKAAIAKQLIKTTAEFDGSSWYRHPSSPRYQDTRDYVTLYIVESGAGVRSLEFFVNYTSRDGWLFVEGAQINVDGKITQLPPTQWARDNDTEIWEWATYRGNETMINLAKAIADSDRSVIRFNGQQFYDDHVITDTEKKVIREMLLAWEAMGPSASD